MKEALTSVDVHFLVHELGEKLLDARVDSVFEEGEKTLVFQLFKSGAGAMDLIVAPNFFCVTSFRRKKPDKPSSFVMQLRKNLKGLFVNSVKQHEFDRIVELELAGGGVLFVLVLEFFSKGNVLLCDGGGKIVGLLKWQKWRDRKLGVGEAYGYPPKVVNPLALDGRAVLGILDSSERDIVRCLASECGLPGLYAEEVCARAGVDKAVKARELGSLKGKVVESFNHIIEEISSFRPSSAIILEEDVSSDVVPMDLKVYGGLESKRFASFNEAVDEYFSAREFERGEESLESGFRKEREKFERRLSEQEKVLSKAYEDAEVLRNKGDALFQRMHELEPLLAEIKALRKKGLSDEEVLARIRERTIVKDLKKTELTLEL